MRTILFGLVFLLSATSAMAKPNVSGNTITWPDDGWYQVQDADTYRSVCGGGSSCSVEPGNYIVINHTTGERFENIQVGQTQRPVTVSGNTISWPDDGWYQVQRADTYESICEGGTSCQVANGNYIVINHTSGKRYSGINVATVTKPKPAPKPEPKPNPVATGPLGCTAPESQIRQRALELINAARAESRMCGTVSYAAAPPVTWNSKLAQAARKHSNDMASNNFFSHTGSDGSSIGNRVTNTDYQWRTVGENIAAGQTSVAQSVEDWVGSPGHCRNLMNPGFTEVALMCVENRGSDYTRYWTNVLGTQR